MRRRISQLIAAVVFAGALVTCDGGSETVLSGPGESCTKTADCESGYKCINQVCQQAGADCPGDLDCAGLECGPDPVCGESCGTCGDGSACEEGGCVELESCGNGACDTGENYSSCPQDCECEPDCSGLDCGPDPVCGESCGTCPSSEGCVDGACAAMTWTDPASGLTWQVTPTGGGGGSMNWENAESHCSDLELAGGGWHLPTIGELRSLIRGCPATESGGSCNVEEGVCLAWSCRDASCIGCEINEGPAGGCYWPDQVEGKCNWYWSSSPMENDTGGWVVAFMYGLVDKAAPNHSWHVRCVR